MMADNVYSEVSDARFRWAVESALIPQMHFVCKSRVSCAGRRPNATGVSYSSLGFAAGDPWKTSKTEFDTKGVAQNRLERRWRSQRVATANLGSLDGDA